MEHHSLLDALDILRGLDLGLQLRLLGCCDLYVRTSRFPQQIRPSLCSFSKRLHQQASKIAIRPCGTQRPKTRNLKGSAKDPYR
jgi:hypothetical protein